VTAALDDAARGYADFFPDGEGSLCFPSGSGSQTFELKTPAFQRASPVLAFENESVVLEVDT